MCCDDTVCPKAHGADHGLWRLWRLLACAPRSLNKSSICLPRRSTARLSAAMEGRRVGEVGTGHAGCAGEQAVRVQVREDASAGRHKRDASAGSALVRGDEAVWGRRYAHTRTHKHNHAPPHMRAHAHAHIRMIMWQLLTCACITYAMPVSTPWWRQESDCIGGVLQLAGRVAVWDVQPGGGGGGGERYGCMLCSVAPSVGGPMWVGVAPEPPCWAALPFRGRGSVACEMCAWSGVHLGVAASPGAWRPPVRARAVGWPLWTRERS